MDLALNKTPMEGYVCPLDTVIYQEETQENIVPDACPDILSVVSTEAQAQLTRKESLEGKVELSGCARVTVLYLPDGEDGPRCLELSVPFRCAASAPGITAGCPVSAVPRITGAETRALNPRKVLVRLELAVSVQCWSPMDDDLCAPWEQPEYALQQRTEELESYVVVAMAEKGFAFTDEVRLTASHPGIQSLLGHRLELRCAEAKVIGSKLIFKGEAVLQARYRTQENTMASGRWELPFSQIMELSCAPEDGACSLDVVERSSEVTLTGDEEGRTIAVHLELLAQAVVRQTRQVKLFTDAYSVTHQVTTERRAYTLIQLWEESTAQEVARETLETPSAARTVEDCFVALGQPQIERDGPEGVMSVQGKVTVLFTGEDGLLACVTAPVSVQCRIGLPEGGNCRVRCGLAGEVQAVATASGVEVRLPIQFSYLTTLSRQREAVVALAVEEREPEEERPSVILRLAQPGECLWDIAKAYSTTTDDILAANELPEPEQLEGCLLLIPRSR